MFIFCMILLIFKIISEDNVFLDYLYLNTKFNYIKVEKGNSLQFYLGSQLLYSNINLSENRNACELEMELINENKDIVLKNESNYNYYVPKDNIICFNKSNLFLRDNNSQIINIIFFEKEKDIGVIPCNDSLIANKNYTCFKDKKKILMETAYGETIFLDKPFIIYHILLIGFFIILNGSIHKVLGIVFHVTLFIYFFIKDIVELCGGFAHFIFPLFIFAASLITGILFSFYIYLQSNKTNHYKDKVIKASYGLLFCYFTFKSIFYYLTFYTGLNKVVYATFLLIFSLGGLCLGLGFSLFFYENLDKYSKHLYISCSAVSGSFFIVKSFGYLLGGYYSDLLYSRYNFIVFDGECKRKVSLYFFIHIILIIVSIHYQIKNEKYRDDEDIESVIRSSDLSTRPSFISRNSNLNTVDDNNTLSINNNESNSNQNDGEGDDDDDNDINDQED